METKMLNSIVEALIMASPEPLAPRKIINQVEELTPSKLNKVVTELNNRYMESGSSFRIRELAGGYQFFVMPEFAGYVEEMFARTRKMRLTRASLETLALVAYKQPVTKTEIEQIRGVASDGVLQNLLEKNMVMIKGRAETVGKPLQYGTTDEFLKFFGINSISDLPKMNEIEAMIAAGNEDEAEEFIIQKDLETGESDIQLNIVNADNNGSVTAGEDNGNYTEGEVSKEPVEKSDDSLVVDIDQTEKS